jgi:hypothetical protein
VDADKRAAHRLYIHFLLGVDYKGLEADIGQMLDLPDQHKKTYTSWTSALLALRADFYGQMDQAAKYTNLVLDSGNFLPVPNMLVMLILARAAKAVEQPGISVATGMYKALINEPCHGGHFVRAVARRELAKLTA